VSETPSLSDILRQIPPIETQQASGLLNDDSGNAKREAQGFASGTLEQESAENEHRRSEALKDHVHSIAVCGVWIVGFLYLSGISIVIWHYVTPWAWLSSEQLHTVTAVVFSSAVTSTGSKYFSRRMN
jgi:hypothetical protein